MDYNQRLKLIKDISYLNGETELIDDLEIMELSQDTRFKLKYLLRKKQSIRSKLLHRRKIINISLRLLELCDDAIE